MKNLNLGIVVGLSLLISASAFAETFNCSFTEPFMSIKIDTTTKKVSVTTPEESNKTFRIRRMQKVGDTTEVVFGAGQEEFTMLRMKLDFKGSDGMSDFKFAYSSEIQTGDVRPQQGGCSSARFPKTDVVLDCQNMGDAIEATICESSLSIECEDSVKTIVSGIQSIRTGKQIKTLAVQELVKGKRYSVTFKVHGDPKSQTNLVTTLQARNGSSCASNSVEVESSFHR